MTEIFLTRAKELNIQNPHHMLLFNILSMLAIIAFHLHSGSYPPVCEFYFGGKGKFFLKKLERRTFPSHPFPSLRNKTHKHSPSILGL